VGGKGTGYRGDCLIIDDPLKAEDAYSEIKRAEAIRWKNETMSSRFNDMETAQEVVIMQRLHADDLTGSLQRAGAIGSAPGMWRHLCLPTEFEPARKSVTYTESGEVFWEDWRKQEGELLFPQKFNAQVVESIKGPTGMGKFAFAGQHQQRPTPAEGGMIQRKWLTYRYLRKGESPITGLTCEALPAKMDSYVMAADCTFKKTEDSDLVAIGVWGRRGANAYLLDIRWSRMGFVDTISAINDLRNKWPQIRQILIEDKANGSAVIEVLRQRVPGIIAVEPEGGKESRVAAISHYFEAGNVWLPLNDTWVSDYIEECAAFPRGTHDDALDMSAYALMRLLSSNNLARLEALARW
jgi:predicted phage terminase large subunit-like protein